MAQFSYAPVSIETQRTTRKRSRIEYDVLMELCAHADALGMCYPGHRRLADMSGRSEESVKTALVSLGNDDIFRCHFLREGVRARATLTYQLNPYCVLYIREQLFDEAIALWDTAKSYNVIRNLTEHVQPEQPGLEPEVEPELKPELEPTTQPQPKNPPLNNGVHVHAYTGLNLINSDKAKTLEQVQKEQKQGKAQAVTNHDEHIPPHTNGASHANGGDKDLTPPVAPPPPFDLPLSDFDDEQTAQSLRIVGTGTTIKRARQLVHEYGNSLVAEAVKQSVGKRNRMGFVVSALSKGWVKPVTDEADWRGYLFDEFGNAFDNERPLSVEEIAYRNARWGIGANQ